MMHGAYTVKLQKDCSCEQHSYVTEEEAVFGSLYEIHQIKTYMRYSMAGRVLNVLYTAQ